ncbi:MULTISPECIES: penicillin-binding protein 1A [Shewanella]|uniref:Penicillin-binding protein 1A n=5 Tax=Shewanella putrefaciens TaxID=24 RepID=E6XHV7_SHEP2|nr:MULTISPECIES: PBP1A family penicillin-binding protein [Shewanella]CAD6365607.1 Penicillin-binding protein 1A [Shewanella hafniensis]AVV84846.1 penicillin-binding protein 1a [Shewanella putrefaciens]MCK7631814.1 PBP1A family penicillin-binding protein [Shewanella sp. JNE9-1]MCK7636025.1 PBP1A family penicillin-binding protein [Shewanella sp. JNE17]MCK7647029.1 PBP1A family penicillin-binding protein [Shewanella sp. JNE3-1]
MKWLKRIVIALFSLALLGVGAIVAAYFYVLPDLPDVSTLKNVQLQTPLRIYSSDGKLISQFGEKRRIPLKLEEVPKPLLQAFLATEDARFYEHGGIDPVGVIRAAVVMLTTGEKKQGASTITMQVARNFFLTRDKTIIRKVKEIFISYHIEQLLTKDEILELYVNRIYLGQRAYGVGAAAQVYFGKNVQDLSLSEMSMIAGLPKAPSTLNPITSHSRALARRNVVLMRMNEVGYINQTEYQLALQEPLVAKYHGAEIDLYAPYISEMARDYMVQKYGEEEAYTNGYNVYTTISSDLQLLAQQALRNNVYAYDERHGYRGAAAVLWTGTRPDNTQIQAELAKITPVQELHPAAVLGLNGQQASVLTAKGETKVINWDGLKWARKFITDKRQGSVPKTAADVLNVGERIWIRDNGQYLQLSQVPEVASATVSLDPQNGAIRTLVGGYSFSQSQYNRVTQAKRQLGSNIKPFIYAAALEKGFTLATLINNAPINKPDISQGTAWRPKNSPDIYGGPTRLRVGLAQSINVMSVRAMRHIGLDAAIAELVKFGFNPNDLPRNESLALGSPSVTPLQVSTAFNVFANGGYLVEPFYIDRVEDSFGNVIEKANPTLACKPSNTAAPQSNDPMNFGNADLATDEPIAYCFGQTGRYAPQIISEQVAFLITEALKSVIWGGGDWSKGTGWQGTAWRAAQLIKRHDIAGKTGTTNESRDTWFSGFSPALTSTFWVGFDDHGRQLGRTAWNANGEKDQITGAEAGAKTAGPGWNEFMNGVLKGTPEATLIPPEGIVSVRIDLATGKLTRKTDYTSAFEYFISGTEPKEYISETQDENSLFIESPTDDLFQ